MGGVGTRKGKRGKIGKMGTDEGGDIEEGGVAANNRGRTGGREEWEERGKKREREVEGKSRPHGHL